MHSGDGGYMDDEGFVFVVDRIKDMIVTGGENVYSAEVEQAVALHPAVAACAIIGIPDAEWGERVHAVCVLAPGAEVTPEELREHCKEHIAGYKAPRSAEFADALPVNGAGKVLKRDLRAPYWEGVDRNVSWSVTRRAASFRNASHRLVGGGSTPAGGGRPQNN